MRFTKMQGTGNDFVILDGAELPKDADLNQLAFDLCDRHYGIGADGLLVVAQDAPDAAFSMRMFNADGTEDMCGNGLRCAALWGLRAGWVDDKVPFRVATKEGHKNLSILHAEEDHRSAQVRVDMGQPKWDAAEIPFDKPMQQVINYPLKIHEETYFITSLNSGSTHSVIFSPSLPDEETFQTISPLIENHLLFPERTSVLWTAPESENALRVRIWERGVGETWGCGTGACAVAAAAFVNHAIHHSPVTIHSIGGTVEIEWNGSSGSLIMTGPAEFVFEGVSCAKSAVYS